MNLFSETILKPTFFTIHAISAYGLFWDAASVTVETRLPLSNFILIYYDRDKKQFDERDWNGCGRYLCDVTVDDVKMGRAWTAITRRGCWRFYFPGPDSSGGGYGWTERGARDSKVAENAPTTAKENNSVCVAGAWSRWQRSNRTVVTTSVHHTRRLRPALSTWMYWIHCFDLESDADQDFRTTERVDTVHTASCTDNSDKSSPADPEFSCLRCSSSS